MSFIFGKADVSDVAFDGEHMRFKAARDSGDDVAEMEFDGRLENGIITGAGSGRMGEFDFTATKEGAEPPTTE